MHINCTGGHFLDGAVIYNLLKGHKADVETWIEGIAASRGSVIALTGDTVGIAENAYCLLHNPSPTSRIDERTLEKPREYSPK
ncbi:ATP-dependent Clp protease proteolytic subunit [Microbulbifer echini]|uniref:ATP-dependent Clp protease proteolytic subunit n=1 Tax=Microbulbifer echini TaxID=1529067 RepID=A0ABV4NRW6_9GAMM